MSDAVRPRSPLFVARIEPGETAPTWAVGTSACDWCGEGTWLTQGDFEAVMRDPFGVFLVCVRCSIL